MKSSLVTSSIYLVKSELRRTKNKKLQQKFSPYKYTYVSLFAQPEQQSRANNVSHQILVLNKQKINKCNRNIATDTLKIKGVLFDFPYFLECKILYASFFKFL